MSKFDRYAKLLYGQQSSFSQSQQPMSPGGSKTKMPFALSVNTSDKSNYYTLNILIDGKLPTSSPTSPMGGDKNKKNFYVRCCSYKFD